MEKTQVYQSVLRGSASGSHKNRLFILLTVCLLLVIGLAVSMALLGESLGRFLGSETNVIPLIPREDTRLESGGERRTEPPANRDGAAPRKNGSTASGRVYKGRLDVFDDRQTWGSETQVDLFRGSYNGSVVSGDGDKVIAPGTSNYYGFALKNNGNIPLDYTVSLKVEPLSEGTEIPLEWRLLDGERTAVSDWQVYNDREETLNAATLEVRRQDNYTIEWRWDFERGVDQADTDLGNAAVERPLGAKATITVFAEQSADWKEPTGPWWLPKTGDDFPLYTYLTVLAVSACGLLLLFILVRRRKKDKENDE